MQWRTAEEARWNNHHGTMDSLYICVDIISIAANAREGTTAQATGLARWEIGPTNRYPYTRRDGTELSYKREISAELHKIQRRDQTKKDLSTYQPSFSSSLSHLAIASTFDPIRLYDVPFICSLNWQHPLPAIPPLWRSRR